MNKRTLVVLILVIIIARSTSIPAQTAASIQLGKEYSFESFNYREEFIRSQNGLGERTRILSENDRRDASFRIVGGLAGQCVSFESVNNSGFYLRHQNSRIKLHQDDGSELFRKDATFCLRDGLASSNDSSFESYNYPGYFVTHNNGHLFIEKRSDQLFAKDATYSVKPALFQVNAANAANSSNPAPSQGTELELNYYYRLTNAKIGDDKSIGNGSRWAELAPTSETPDQLWQLIPRSRAYSLQNATDGRRKVLGTQAQLLDGPSTTYYKLETSGPEGNRTFELKPTPDGYYTICTYNYSPRGCVALSPSGDSTPVIRDLPRTSDYPAEFKWKLTKVGPVR